MEFESVKEALAYLYEASQSNEIKVDGKEATTKDYQDLIADATVNIADLLGMSEIYLGGA